MICCRFKTYYGRCLCIMSSCITITGLLCTMVGLFIMPTGLPPHPNNRYISTNNNNYQNDYNVYLMQSFGYYLMTRIGLPILGSGMLGFLYMYKGHFIYDEYETPAPAVMPEPRPEARPEPKPEPTYEQGLVHTVRFVPVYRTTPSVSESVRPVDNLN